ncbi:MAG TPA: TRAP transporter small permease [Acetobacteraceae bacterium]|jgi:C4-dicarboxylate transporter, DctQ subunit|nr:TRAP transporter small permease [Acetobacteraceae bacterium]
MSAPDTARPGDRLARVIAVWDRVERLLVGLLGAFALVIAVIQVVGRYLDPANAITWAEEVIVYVAVWAVMIAASELVHRDGHVRPDLVLRLLKPRVQRWVEMFNCLVAIAFTFGMVWYGWVVVATAQLLDQRSSTDLQFPMWIYYLALPTGGGLMCIRYVIRLLRYAFFFDPRTMTVGQHIAVHDEVPDPAITFTE